MICTDRATGREYQLVKIYRSNGNYMGRDLRRYSVVKRYI